VIVYPAIDLRNGTVVRLREGRADQMLHFSDSPLEAAQHWIDQGAAWLHVVNLDGALGQPGEAAARNLLALRQIAALGVLVQFGGGVRSFEAVQTAREAGAQRIVLGTAAIEQPALVEQAVAAFGADAVCLAVDARDGFVVTRGWTHSTPLTPAALVQRYSALGLTHVLFTDVSRDGMLSGSNLNATIMLAATTGASVIASGGITTADEIRQLAAGGVAGAVVGMALYTGALRLADALRAAQETNTCSPNA
jgi:phosphoribosylformimino-5-aminoimidazole carboxamide ribotide isomerase